jgi:hypothetical protein
MPVQTSLLPTTTPNWSSSMARPRMTVPTQLVLRVLLDDA